MIIYGDASAALAGIVRDALSRVDEPFAVGVTVGTRSDLRRDPLDRPGPRVEIAQDGPGRVRERVVSEVTIRGAVWHQHDDDAFDLAQYVHGILTDPRLTGDGDVVRAVSANGLSPYTVPGGDPDTGEALASFTVTAYVRARIIPTP